MDFLNEVKQRWGDTEAFKEFEKKTAGKDLTGILTPVFKKFGEVKDSENPDTKGLVELLQKTITDNFYTCTPEILKGLGQMYSSDLRFKETIDKIGGPGTAAFVSKAIEKYGS